MASGDEIREGKGSDDVTRHIDRMASRESIGAPDQPGSRAQPLQSYGDLAALNTSRLILDSVGASLLFDIVSNFMELPETSCAVFERNGDYALSLSSSGWCRFMDTASRQRCGVSDNQEAMGSGKWHCHESCWNDAARCSIEREQPVDVVCRGGIRVFAVPVCAGREILGSISVGYGNPPQDPEKLQELASAYGVDVEELREKAMAHEMRPLFLSELAKKRVLFSARLIGEIVERRRTEEALRKSEEKFHNLFDNVKDALFIHDLEGHILEVNREACERLGYSHEELLNLSPADIDTPEQSAMFDDRVEALRREGELLFEAVHRRRDGTSFPVEVCARFFEWAGKQLVLSVCRDITERKQAEAALRQLEEKSSAVVRHAKDGMIIIQDNVLQFVNAAMADMLGYAINEMENMPFIDYVAPECRAMVAARVEAQLAGRDVLQVYEVQMLHKDGTIIDAELSACVIHYRGKPADVGIVRDITERKRAEAALAESEERFSVFMAHLPAVAFIKDKAGRLLFANRYLQETFGWHECVGKTTEELLSCEVAELMMADDRRALTEGPTVIQERITDTRGKERFFETYKFPLATESGSVLLGGIAVDVTERKRAEEALRQSEEAYRLLFEQSADGIFITADMQVVKANQAFYALHGMPVERVIGMDPLDLLQPEDRDAAARRIQSMLDGGPFNTSSLYRALRPDGSVFWVDVRSNPIMWNGQPAIQSIVRDITDRKRAEEALRESEARFRQVVESSPLPMGIANNAGMIEYLNPRFIETFGYTLDDVPQLADWYRLAYPDPAYRESVVAKWRKAVEMAAIENRAADGIEVEVACKDGSVRTMKILGTPMGSKVLAVFSDLTERKKMEQALRENERKYRSLYQEFRAILEAIPDGLCQLSPDMRIQWANEVAVAATKMELQDLVGQPCYQARHGRLEPCEGCPVRQCLATRKPVVGESITPDGRIWELHSLPLFDRRGEVKGVIEVARNITERKQAEKALRETNETLRALIQASPAAIVAFGAEGEVKLWNPAAERLFGWREGEVIGRFLPQVSAEQRKEHETLRERVLRGAVLTDIETRRCRKDGSAIALSISAAPLHDAQGKVSGVMSISVDITERKRAEEDRAKLEAQMREVQKLESLGVLAGGIAHDFNNLLMAILGNADLALFRLSPASPARHNVEEIGRASQRAADLCRQMLAYSGKGQFVVGR